MFYMENRVHYELRQEVPSVSDYIHIRLNAGLSRKSEEAATIGLSNSIFSVVVYFNNDPIGIGRIIGDGGCFFEITDMAVLPEHQKKGVGALIMKALVDYLQSHAPSTAYVSLMADHGTPHFYGKFGFTLSEMPKSSGMYMRIK
ncbi:MAG: GNAT superfamily N-acetyltransferase [Flavobacteriaceae bacterium]|jgi:GNAT superfamily N-acetyltransferase